MKEENKIEKILEFINQEIKENSNYIKDRAKGILKVEELTEDQEYELLEIDSDGDIFEYWELADKEDHNFELGLIRAYKNIKRILK